jgi:hypothetical protein
VQPGLHGDEGLTKFESNERFLGGIRQVKSRSVASSITLAQAEGNVQAGKAVFDKQGVRDGGRRWGVILAGGDGVRLRELTRFVSGDDRPKQFCPFLGKYSLLQEARQRAERSIYLRDLGDRPSQRVVQPCNKGTAPAILYTLLQISQMDPDAIVAILPCDHYYSRENVFTEAFRDCGRMA